VAQLLPFGDGMERRAFSLLSDYISVTWPTYMYHGLVIDVEKFYADNKIDDVSGETTLQRGVDAALVRLFRLAVRDEDRALENDVLAAFDATAIEIARYQREQTEQVSTYVKSLTNTSGQELWKLSETADVDVQLDDLHHAVYKMSLFAHSAAHPFFAYRSVQSSS
jgi:hypothetical protein